MNCCAIAVPQTAAAIRTAPATSNRNLLLIVIDRHGLARFDLLSGS
jgi:hypothetical protein